MKKLTTSQKGRIRALAQEVGADGGPRHSPEEISAALGLPAEAISGYLAATARGRRRAAGQPSPRVRSAARASALSRPLPIPFVVGPQPNLSAQEKRKVDLVVEEILGIADGYCPTCRFSPEKVRARGRVCEDLALDWVSVGENAFGEVVVRRRCRACRPDCAYQAVRCLFCPFQILIPADVGELSQWPAELREWFVRWGAQLVLELGLVCVGHREQPMGWCCSRRR